jgi:F-type H+/Na+-transporting ATPase subunit alpha
LKLSSDGTPDLSGFLARTREQLRALRAAPLSPGLHFWEVGTVRSVGRGVARVTGLPSVGADELVFLADQVPALVFNLDAEEVGVVLLGREAEVRAGSQARGSGRPLEVPVGPELLGRVIDPLGRPLDGAGGLRARRTRPIESPAPAILERAPVQVPLQTGLKVVDALVPIGRGQRELIVGDRQTGKTTIALEAMLNQRDGDVISIYCAVGQRGASVARVVDVLRKHDALARSVVVVTSGEDPAGLQFVAPYAATAMAEAFLRQGRDVLLVLDDLTRHARAYRELSLLLRRPPGREGYPGDIFYIHARLLERATQLREDQGGGAITALPIVETQAGNLSAYIPTNLISITDGQIYLSPDLFRKGILPAVDVGRSVSRVGGAAQLPAYRAVVGDLKLAYAQYQELEVFSRFSAQLDADTRKRLERGRRVRQILKQAEHDAQEVAEQISVLFATTQGLLDDVPLEALESVEARLRRSGAARIPELWARLRAGTALDEASRNALEQALRDALVGA